MTDKLGLFQQEIESVIADSAFAGAELQLQQYNRQGELKAIIDPQQREQCRQKLIEQYCQQHVNPWEAAQVGKIDRIISASAIRTTLTQELPPLFAAYHPPQTDRKFPSIPL